jgi:hypothetical protein
MNNSEINLNNIHNITFYLTENTLHLLALVLIA